MTENQCTKNIYTYIDFLNRLHLIMKNYKIMRDYFCKNKKLWTSSGSYHYWSKKIMRVPITSQVKKQHSYYISTVEEKKRHQSKFKWNRWISDLNFLPKNYKIMMLNIYFWVWEKMNVVYSPSSINTVGIIYNYPPKGR